MGKVAQMHGIRCTQIRHSMHIGTAFGAYGTAFDALKPRHPMHITHGIRCTFSIVENPINSILINGLQSLPKSS